MTFTLAGWYESQDSAVLVPAAALTDQHLTIDGDGIVVPDALTNIVALYAGGADITRAQLQSPSIRAFIDAEISPLAAALEPGDPLEVMDLRQAPLIVDADELLEMHFAEDGSGAKANVGLAWFADGPISPVAAANFRTLRATSTTAAVAVTWTNTGALSFGETLPAGSYRIIGFRAVSATSVAARLVFPGNAWRPGSLGSDDEQGHGSHNLFRFGNFGDFGTFEHNRPPTVDVLCTGTDSSHVFLFDIVPA